MWRRFRLWLASVVVGFEVDALIKRNDYAWTRLREEKQKVRNYRKAMRKIADAMEWDNEGYQQVVDEIEGRNL